MHEWSLADAVVATVDKIFKENNAKAIKSVTVLIGELQQIDREVFDFGLENLLKGHPYDLSVFRFATEPASFHCNYCQKQWDLGQTAAADEVHKEQQEVIHFLPEAARVYLRCPACGSSDFTVEKGRGVTIASIELEVDQETDS